MVRESPPMMALSGIIPAGAADGESVQVFFRAGGKDRAAHAFDLDGGGGAAIDDK